ncbi:MAG TPA: four helix bundle protein [Kofleriaceae bacterium]
MHPTEFDHERLDVYRLTVEFIAWVGVLIDERLGKTRPSAVKHLDEASTSIALNIAEGNGKRSAIDRARFLDIARGSALESAACLDVLAARKRLEPSELAPGKNRLIRIVSMLTKLIERLLATS